MKRVDIWGTKDGKPAITGAENQAYAWEEGRTIDQMERVVWKTLEFMNDQGIKDTKGIWVSIASDNRRWNPQKQKFVDRLTGVDL